MGQTIACANQKGGVGKTTTVLNVAAYLALAGKRVLLIDLDPQGNATSGFGIDRGRVGRSVYEALVDATPLSELAVPTAIDGLSLVPAAMGLAGAEVELAPMSQRERRLARLIGELTDPYDFVFFDCPPSLGLLTVNALTAADSVLVPLQCEYYALEGLTQLIATLNLVRDHLNPRLEVLGIVLTMYDARTKLSADVADEVRRHFGAKVFETVVPRSVRLSEAPSFGLPICLYRPDSPGALAYRAVAGELLARSDPWRGAPAESPSQPVTSSRDGSVTTGSVTTGSLTTGSLTTGMRQPEGPDPLRPLPPMAAGLDGGARSDAPAAPDMSIEDPGTGPLRSMPTRATSRAAVDDRPGSAVASFSAARGRS
ncbi:MAG: hypothetical protein C4343_00450 [Chloroflexota bacterium]